MKKSVFLLCIFVFITTITYAQNEIRLNSSENKKLNTFFSNFSEANVKSFSSETLSDELLLDFALTHNYKNNFNSLKKSENNLSVIIPAALVDKTTEKFFGRKMRIHRLKNYLLPVADGEAYTFSQVKRLFKRSDGTFQVNGVVFSASSGFTGDPQGTPRDWKKSGDEVDCIGEFTGIIKKSPINTDRFILLTYVFSAKNVDTKTK